MAQLLAESLHLVIDAGELVAKSLVRLRPACRALNQLECLPSASLTIRLDAWLEAQRAR